MIYRTTQTLKLALPFWQYAAAFQRDGYGFLLDSGMDPKRLGRFSFLGGNPVALMTAKRPQDDHVTLGLDIQLATWRQPDGRLEDAAVCRQWFGDPFEALRQLQGDYTETSDSAGSDLPFQGGLVGYFGYETAYAIEKLPDQGEDDLQLPDLAFMVVDSVLALDHQSGQTTLTVTGRGADMSACKVDADQTIQSWRTRLDDFAESALKKCPPGGISPKSSAAPCNIDAHFDRPAYCRAVQQCRDHILDGDIFEVCLTHRLETDLPCPPWHLYSTLRDINPAPFAAWLQFPDFQVISASPERFLSLSADGQAESRPIKGTRPRGATPEEDQALRDDLATAEKDRAENLMIVDLVRNDLGRVAQIGSVRVPELLAVESYATVHQLVSTVQADLRPDKDAFSLVRACFPGGSMTGAPKIEAMKIIDTIEPVKRSVYSGAIGYFDRSGAMDLSIVIRTLLCKDNRVTFGVGGAITADSDPDAEYTETMDKAKALIAALNQAKGSS